LTERLPNTNETAWNLILDPWLKLEHNTDGTHKFSGTPTGAKFLRDDRTWAALPPAIDAYNVELAAYGAVRDVWFADGVATSGSTTFTSAAATFTGADVGKLITIMGGGITDQLPKTTLINSVSDAHTIIVNNAPERSVNPARFYYGPDNTTAIQAAIDAAAAAGGGCVYLPGSYAHRGLVLKSRTGLMGAGKMTTRLRLWPSSNKPCVRNDYTVDNNAQGTFIRDLMIEGNRQNQSDVATTLTAQYTAGGGTMALTSAAAINPSGTAKLTNAGVNGGLPSWYLYSAKSGNTITLLARGIENTTDQTFPVAGTTVTIPVAHGIYFYKDPPVAVGGNNEWYDMWHVVDNCFVWDVRGDGFNHYGESEVRVNNTAFFYSKNVGVRPSYDSKFSNVTVGQSSRMGWVLGTMQTLVNCSTYYSGVDIAADGYGYMVDLTPPASDYEGGCIISGCSAQDNKADGFFLRAADRAQLNGCQASSNGTGVAGSVGVLLVGAQDCIIDVTCVDRTGGANATQRNAISIDNTSQGNMIRLTHGGSGTTVVDSWLKTGSVIEGSNEIIVGGSHQPTKRANQSVTNSATLTDDTDLQVYLSASLKYRIQGVIYFSTTAAGDFKYGFVGPTTPTLVLMNRTVGPQGTAPAEVIMDTTLPTAQTAVGGLGSGCVKFDCIIHNSTNAGVFKFQFAQNTQTGSESATVHAGSWMTCALVPA
jgi:parallel beta-helix repeat protein